MEAPPSPSPGREHKKSKRTKRPGKVRKKLPGIESYEKELEFPAEGPGRVIVRLERLMGSDKIRITDPKYLSTLLERLEAEETQAWGSRSRLRKKAEKNRSRQLAIEGLMEPAEDMQDLWNHPVFRVNRILNRLAVFDHNMSILGAPSDSLPPITTIEPFTEDESGAIFKNYPGHTIFYKKELPFSRMSFTSRRSVRASRASSAVQLRDGGSGKVASASKTSLAKGSKEPSVADLSVAEEEDEEGDEEEEEEEDEEGVPSPVKEPIEEVAEPLAPKPELVKLVKSVEDVSLQELQKLYGVPSEEDLAANWSPYRANLVNMFYEAGEKDSKEMFEMGEDVTGVYLREQLTTDDYVEEHPPSVNLNETSYDDLLGIDPLVDIDILEDEEEEEGGEEEGRHRRKKKKCVPQEREGDEGEDEDEDEEEDEEEGEEGEDGCVDDDEDDDEEDDNKEEEIVETRSTKSIAQPAAEDDEVKVVGETAEDNTYLETAAEEPQEADQSGEDAPPEE